VTTGVQSVYELKLERERIGAEVREKQKRLDEIVKAVEARSTRYMDPDEFKRLQQERTFAEIELQSLTAKRAAIEASIERMERRLQSVLAVKKQIESIDSKIDNASRTLVQIGDLQLDAVEGRNRASAVKVLRPAAVPDKPVQPIKIYHVGLTAVLSLFFSIGLVYLFSYFNVRALLPSRERGEREDGEAAGAHG
jgi:uncharacterized protein involved in exopolysaccharide biosynthesis